jgi:hypothetical protein
MVGIVLEGTFSVAAALGSGSSRRGGCTLASPAHHVQNCNLPIPSMAGTIPGLRATMSP